MKLTCFVTQWLPAFACYMQALLKILAEILLSHSWQDKPAIDGLGTGCSSRSLKPVAMLQQHQHPVVAMLAGLTGRH